MAGPERLALMSLVLPLQCVSWKQQNVAYLQALAGTGEKSSSTPGLAPICKV